MLLVSWIFFYFLTTVFAEPIVSIKQGQLNGTELKSRDGKKFYAFYGIPYAAPPTGNLRFASPHKAPSWQGIRNASKKAPICIQPDSFADSNPNIIGQEDCLYLSVFTPKVNSSKLLPIMVYIHGGAYHVGSGDSKGPNFFMDKSIVVVTMNYRHGIFGFLSSGDTKLSGNYALKDQVAALKWVKSNIADFGGDPNMITILGQSSGAACVHLHTLSPSSKGLFHRAIMQSGSAMSFWSHYDAHHAKRSFTDLIARLNYTLNDTTEMLQYLRRLPAEDLIRVEHSFRTEKRIVMKFRPVVEKRRVKNAFMTVSPRKLNYQDTNIPWIIGFNSAEGMMDTILFLSQNISYKKINKKFSEMMPYFLHYKYFTKKGNTANLTKTLKNFYFKDGIIKGTNHQQLCNLIGDIIFGMPILQAAYTYPGQKYFYYYDYATNPSDIAAFFNSNKTYDIKGASHSHEMVMFFSGGRFEELTENQKQLSLQLITYWSNFIITGNPNSADQPMWNTLQADTGEYLHIGNGGIKMEKDLLHDRYDLWKNINNL